MVIGLLCRLVLCKGMVGVEVIVTSQIDSFRASMRTVVLIKVVLELILQGPPLSNGKTHMFPCGAIPGRQRHTHREHTRSLSSTLLLVVCSGVK